MGMVEKVFLIEKEGIRRCFVGLITSKKMSYCVKRKWLLTKMHSISFAFFFFFFSLFENYKQKNVSPRNM